DGSPSSLSSPPPPRLKERGLGGEVLNNRGPALSQYKDRLFRLPGHRNVTPTGFGFGVVIREIVLIWEGEGGNFKGYLQIPKPNSAQIAVLSYHPSMIFIVGSPSSLSS